MISASWVGLACAGTAVSDIKNPERFAGFARAATPILPPLRPLPEPLARGRGT
jgi:hypothetical protein